MLKLVTCTCNSVIQLSHTGMIVYDTCTLLHMYLQELRITYSFAHCSLRDFCLASHFTMCEQRHNQGNNVHIYTGIYCNWPSALSTVRGCKVISGS